MILFIAEAAVDPAVAITAIQVMGSVAFYYFFFHRD